MKPIKKLPKSPFLRSAISHGKEGAIIAAGSVAGAAAYDGIKHKAKSNLAPLPNASENTPPRKKTDLGWKNRAAWVGTIGAGDVVGEEVHDAIKDRKKKKGVQKTTAVPGNGPTSLARKPAITAFIQGADPYPIRRAALRGKKRPGVPKIAKFQDERTRTNLDPKKKSGNKAEKFRDVGVGVGTLAGGAGVAYAGRKIGKAAEITEKLQKHIGGLATSTHDKVNAHIDYVGHHAGNAAEESAKAAKSARKTTTAYHPRAIVKMVGSKLKRIPLLNRFVMGPGAVTEFDVMKEKHPKGEERHPSWIQANAARVAGTVIGAAGTAAFLAKYKRPGSSADVTRGRGITKIVKKPERPAVVRRPPEPISNVRQVPVEKPGKKNKTKMSAHAGVTELDAQGRDSSGRMAPKAELLPSYRKARQIVVPARRGGEIAQDLHDIARGKAKDPKKKRFYEKAWFQGGALALAGAVGIRQHRIHAEKNGYHPYFSAELLVTNLSAFMRDVPVRKLDESTQRDIAQVLPLKRGTKVAHYGMVPSELIGKADPHNLKTARKHVAGMSPLRARRDVDGKPNKHVLLLNDRIVDGHHHLAKAERAGITRSLPVLDLTPARFQLAAARSRVTDLAFLIHDDAFPLLPMKQPKLPKGARQRVPVAETKQEVIDRLKARTQLSRRDFGTGVGKVVAETVIDATTRGADIASKKKRPTKAMIAAKNADPDLVPTNNWTADPQAPVVKMARRVPLINFFTRLPVGIPPTRPTPKDRNHVAARTDDHKGQSTKNHGFDKFNRMHQSNGLSRKGKKTEFYGTSAGVTASWDTRGRREDTARRAHWWTHSPTKNSVRVVRSHSEKGPRTRRPKKFHEKTKTHKAALIGTSVAAAGLGALAVVKHRKLKALEGAVHRPGRIIAVSTPRGKGKSPNYRDITPKRPIADTVASKARAIGGKSDKKRSKR